MFTNTKFHRFIYEGTETVNLFLIMSGSFWFAILACSIIGLFRPDYMEPILLVQLIYKSLYSIYFAIVFNSFKFAPYGYVFCFFLPWIIILVIYFSIRLFKKFRETKSSAQLGPSQEDQATNP
jgi:hypothetical protein